MPGFVMTKQVAAPAGVVFDVFADLDRADQLVSAIVKIEKLTDGPMGVGTRWRETRKVFKREATEEMWITDFEPGRHFSVGCEACGCVYGYTFRFEPQGDETRVEFEMSYRPVTFFAKVMSPLAKIMSGTMKKCMEKDLDELKAAAESGGALGAEQALA